MVRKPTPERKRSPLKGKNLPDQSENSKPVDCINARLIDQHRWPSRTGGKVSLNASNSSSDLPEKITRGSASISGIGLSTIRRMPSSDGSMKPLQRSTSNAERRMATDESDRGEADGNSFEDDLLVGPKRLLLTSLADRMTLSTPAVRSQSLPIPGSRLPSPSRTSITSSSVSRGASPSRTRPSTPPSRGISPSRIRPANVSTQSSSSTSVLSFIVDFRKGKKSAGFIEDAHQLRLMHNRNLQWRFANARAEAVLHDQKALAEVEHFIFSDSYLSRI